MRNFVMIVGLLAALSSPAFAQDHHRQAYAKAGPPAQDRKDVDRQIRLPDGGVIAVLKPEVVRGLQILPVPDQPTAGPSVSTYWNCTQGPEGFDDCDLRIIVCTTEGEQCVEIP